MTLRASLGAGDGGVLVHQPRQQLLVEAAPVDADAHRLGVLQRQLDDRRELPVALGLEADVAGVDAILVERFGAGGVLGQQRVAVVVEVADQRHAHAHLRQAVADVRHGLGGLVAVDGDAHELGAGAGERRRLAGGALDVGRVGVGHRLHDDRGIAADDDAADVDGDRGLAGGAELYRRGHEAIGAILPTEFTTGEREGDRLPCDGSATDGTAALAGRNCWAILGVRGWLGMAGQTGGLNHDDGR